MKYKTVVLEYNPRAKKMAEEVEKATNDYTKGNYDPSYCNKKEDYNKHKNNPSVQKQNNERKYDCTQGYQDSWERNSKVAPRTPKENSNNQ